MTTQPNGRLTLPGITHNLELRPSDNGQVLLRAWSPSVVSGGWAEAEGAVWKGGPQVRIDHDELRRLRNTSAVIAYVAHRLRQALVEHKLDDEEAARGGDR